MNTDELRQNSESDENGLRKTSLSNPSKHHQDSNFLSDTDYDEDDDNQRSDSEQIVPLPCSLKLYILAFAVLLAFILAYAMRFNLNHTFSEIALNLPEHRNNTPPNSSLRSNQVK